MTREDSQNRKHKSDLFDNLKLITDPVSCELRKWGDELLFTLL